MALKSQLDQDIKTALLSGNKDLATTLKGLKTVIQYAEVAPGAPSEGLSDDEIIQLFSKEAKKRQESADLYRKGGSDDKAATEEAEKQVIMGYLPSQLSEAELTALINDIVASIDNPQMGQVIGAVKAKAGASADGAMVARLVKQVLGS